MDKAGCVLYPVEQNREVFLCAVINKQIETTLNII